MKRYKLLKDLPTFKAGTELELSEHGNLGKRGDRKSDFVVVLDSNTLSRFPNILQDTDWFEEIPEQPRTVWNLKIGDRYWLSSSSASEIFSARWDDDSVDHSHRSSDNCFLTRKDAEKELARRKAKVILERDTKGFKPDYESWSGGFEVYWSQSRSVLDYTEYPATNNGTIRFATEEDAESSIKAHPNEWKIYLGVED